MNIKNLLLTFDQSTNSHPRVTLKRLVRAAILPGILLTGLASGTEVEPDRLVKFATCQDSWLEWKDDARRTDQYVESFDQGFTRIEEEAAFLPKDALVALGFPVTKVYPQSVGMGVGFSILLAAPLQQVRVQVEKLVGKPLQCSVDEGMTSCSIELAEKKSVMLASEGDAAEKSSLLGCFYYYEK